MCESEEIHTPEKTSGGRNISVLWPQPCSLVNSIDKFPGDITIIEQPKAIGIEVHVTYFKEDNC